MSDKSFTTKSDEYLVIQNKDATIPNDPSLVVVPKSQFYSDSITPLGISGVFSGTARDTLGRYFKFRAIAFADQASASNGFVIQESSNGSTNWRTVAQATVSASTATTLEANVFKRFCRVQYTNGGTAQGSFELTTALSVF